MLAEKLALFLLSCKMTQTFFLLLYADDIVIITESSEGLQKPLNTLYDYSQHWKLTVNINKTKIMFFRSGGILPKKLVFTYDGKELDFVDDFKYLGISFTAGGAFTPCYVYISWTSWQGYF